MQREEELSLFRAKVLRAKQRVVILLPKFTPWHYEEVSRQFSFIGEDADLLNSSTCAGLFYLFKNKIVTHSAPSALTKERKKTKHAKMDRSGLFILIAITVALVQISDTQKDTTGGGRTGGAAADRTTEQQARYGGQGHSAGRSGELSAGSSHSGNPVRLPRGASSQREGRHASAAAPARPGGASREDQPAAPRDSASRTARHPVSQQHRPKVARRQNSKPSSASARRLAG